MTKDPKCLVIDTDIARSAGGLDALEGRSKSCRDFLTAVLETDHKVVTTEATRIEWHKHQSRFTKTWFVSMIARRKVCWIEAPADEELREKVVHAATSEKKRDAMLKDIHLLEAALPTDKIVISMDETVRHCFREIAQVVSILKPIVWVNPCIHAEISITWLKNGAIVEKERQLGQQ